MTKASDFLENKLLDHTLRNVAYTSPPTVYLALYTSDPTDANTGTEVIGGSYAREVLAMDPASSGSISNTSNVVFTEATAPWGTITHFAIFDALTVGNLLVHGALTSSKVIGTSDTFKVNASNLTVTLD